MFIAKNEIRKINPERILCCQAVGYNIKSLRDLSVFFDLCYKHTFPSGILVFVWLLYDNALTFAFEMIFLPFTLKIHQRIDEFSR